MNEMAEVNDGGGVAAVPPGGSSGLNITLWVLQVLLAALFIFGGVAKLRMSADALAQATGVPGELMWFVSVCEILGGLALVVPGLIGRWRILTPLAAVGLTLIMIGAVVITALTPQPLMAIFPLIVGLLCAFVAYKRRG